MIGFPFAGVFATLSLYLLVASAMAKAGRASPKNRALRAPAPEWMKEGVPRLRMEDHLRDRKPATQPDVPVVP